MHTPLRDLVAVSLLSVDVLRTAAPRILWTRAKELAMVLEKIPNDRELRGSVDGGDRPGSPADDLCFAKLLPVIDSFVTQVLGHLARELLTVPAGAPQNRRRSTP